jgi:hypothetical protein
MRVRIQIRICINNDGSGSGRPKNHPDPDPQHCFLQFFTSMLVQEGVKEEHHGGIAMFLLNKYIAVLHVARQDFLKGNLRLFRGGGGMRLGLRTSVFIGIRNPSFP